MASCCTINSSPGNRTDMGACRRLIWAGSDLIQEAFAGAGLAIAFASDGPALPCFDRILSAENAARGAHRGFWRGRSLPDATPVALAARIGRFADLRGSCADRRQPAATRSYLNFGHALGGGRDGRDRRPGSRRSLAARRRLRRLPAGASGCAAFWRSRGGPLLSLRSPAQLEVLDSATPAKPVTGSGVAP